MEVWNGDLYVGGNFTSVSGIATSRVTRWDGSEWSPVLAGVSRMGNDPCYVNELRATPNYLPKGSFILVITDAAGKQVRQQQLTGTDRMISIAHPAPGVNVLSTISGAEESHGRSQLE